MRIADLHCGGEAGEHRVNAKREENDMSRICMTALVAIGLAAGGGCRKASEKLAEKMIEKSSGGKAQVSIDGDRISVKTKDGEMETAAGGNATIPADFPKDVLVLKDAKILATTKVPDAFSVQMQSAETVEKLVSRYEAEMKAQGWAQEASYNTGDATILSYSKDKGSRQASVVISKDDKGAQVVVTAGRTKKNASVEEPNPAPADEGANP